MRLVKLSTLCSEFDVSANTVKKYIKLGEYKREVHFKEFPFGTRFNTTAILKHKEKDDFVERLIDVMLQ